MMDWMQWSLTPSPPGSIWPAVPQDVSETLALTTALGCSLLACETCMLSCCFHPVSMSNGDWALSASTCVSAVSCQKMLAWEATLEHDGLVLVEPFHVPRNKKASYFLSPVYVFWKNSCDLVRFLATHKRWKIDSNTANQWLGFKQCSLNRNK